jgi:hypothetical protein
MTEPYGPSTPTDPGDEPVSPKPDQPTGATGDEPVTPNPDGGAPTSAGDEPVTPTADGPAAATGAGGDGAAPRSYRLLIRIAAVVLVVVVGVVAYIAFFQKSDPTAAKVGDCVSITMSGTLATATRLSCDDVKALYVVTAAGPSVQCDAYEASYFGSTRDRAKLCLFYNVKVGDCLKVTANGDGEAKGACEAGMLKVVLVSTDTADASTCPASADVARPDVTRKRLICFATVT